VLDQHRRGKIEMRPAFAQQLGYVADVHRGRHGFSSIRAKTVTKGKQTILPQKPPGCQIIVGSGVHVIEMEKGEERAFLCCSYSI
jgi:hypothetical protein